VYFIDPVLLIELANHALQAWSEGFRRRAPAAAVELGRTRIGIETGSAIVGDVGIRSASPDTAIAAIHRSATTAIKIAVPEAGGKAAPSTTMVLAAKTGHSGGKRSCAVELAPDSVGTGRAVVRSRRSSKVQSLGLFYRGGRRPKRGLPARRGAHGAGQDDRLRRSSLTHRRALVVWRPIRFTPELLFEYNASESRPGFVSGRLW